jgi:hypothetical protein
MLKILLGMLLWQNKFNQFVLPIAEKQHRVLYLLVENK